MAGEFGQGEEVTVSPSNVKEWRTYFASPEKDLAVFKSIASLREGIEKPEDWAKTKELAKKELETVPDDIIPKIFEKLNLYMEVLPAGHSKRHLYRDFITSMILLQDPWVKNLDEVEKFVGVMAGTFHDIGNSVVNRYEETKRFAGHAETGAFLFGEVVKDLLPQSPSLMKLVQFAIAAHTHYTRDIEVKRVVNGGEITVIKKPYDDTLDKDNNKAGIWLARWADRLDVQGVQAFVRHAITKAEPTEDYDQEGFHQIEKGEIEDFRHHLAPTMRTENFAGGRNTLEHITMFRDSALGTSVYSKHDTPFFTEELVMPNADEQKEFIDKVVSSTGVSTKEQREKNFNIFYDMCRLVDGGSNIEEVIELFKRKFEFMSDEQLSHWANGFTILPQLYNRVLARMTRQLEASRKLDTGKMFKDAIPLAFEKLEELKKVA